MPGQPWLLYLREYMGVGVGGGGGGGGFTKYQKRRNGKR